MPTPKALSTSPVTADHDKGRKATDLFRHAYNGVGLDDDHAQHLNQNPEFPDKLDKLIRECSAIPPPAFSELKSFQVTVRKGYKQEGYLDSLRLMKSGELYYWSPEYNDKNYPDPSHQLVAGKTYLAKLIAINRMVTSAECLAEYRKHKAYLTGAQGGAYVWEHYRDELPRNRWTVSFDEEARLWKDAVGHRRVPRVNRHDGGDCGLLLGYFGYPWGGNNVLLLLCDLPSA